MKQTGLKLFMSVYGKAHIIYPSSSTCSTHFTTWLAGKLKCHYQDSVTSIGKTFNITTDVIM